MTRREVRVTDQFFARLDELVPPERTADGRPSAADFLLHDLPLAIEALSRDAAGTTFPIGNDGDIRILIGEGFLVTAFVLYVALAGAEVVEVLCLDIDDWGGPLTSPLLAKSSAKRGL